MKGFWLLVHVLCFTLWLGGGIETMVAGIRAKALAPGERLKAYQLIGAIQRLLVGPGAAAVVLSGVILSIPYMQGGAMAGWLTLMMGAGVLAALIALGISVPTASRLARLEVNARGDLPEAFPRLRQRQVIGASLAGALGLVALAAATLVRG